MDISPGPVAPATQAADPQDFGIPVPPPGAASTPGRAVVTGASTGIGWETVKILRAQGWQVVATARRAERLAALAKETGCEAFCADLTDPEHIEKLVDFASQGGSVTSLVNVAGGALGVDTVLEAKVERWQQMYANNVLTSLRATKAFVPKMLENGGGDVVFITSIAGYDAYPGGSGYTAAKHAETMLPQTLRLELVGQPIRIIEIAPGLVQTPEFSLHRLGDKEAAQQVYSEVDAPLTGADIAQAVAWTLSLPAHVNVDFMTMKPVEQATSTIKRRIKK